MTSWEQIVNDHGRVAYCTAWKILHHQQDCEDVLQEVFVEAYALYASESVTHWRTFLARLVTYRSLDSLRRRRFSTTTEHLPLLDKSPSPEELIIASEEAEWVRTMVAELPEHQAAVFCLAHFEELSHSEIASILSISTNAVSVALHKARAKLRHIVALNHKEHQK